MRRIRRRQIASLVCNCIIICLTAYSLLDCAVLHILSGGLEFPTLLRYFTVLSNIFLAVVCLIQIPFNIRSLNKTRSKCSFVGTKVPAGTLAPKWIIALKQTAVIEVTLTCIVACTFLTIIGGPEKTLYGINLIMHAVNPVIAIICYIFFDFGEEILYRTVFLGPVVMAVYGIVYFLNVIIYKTWPDFYGFNSGILEGKWYITLVGILAILMIFGSIWYAAHKSATKLRLHK